MFFVTLGPQWVELFDLFEGTQKRRGPKHARGGWNRQVLGVGFQGSSSGMTIPHLTPGGRILALQAERLDPWGFLQREPEWSETS